MLSLYEMQLKYKLHFHDNCVQKFVYIRLKSKKNTISPFAVFLLTKKCNYSHTKISLFTR